MGGLLAKMFELQLKIEQAFHPEIGKTPLRPGNSSVGKGGAKQWRGSCNLISQYFRGKTKILVFSGDSEMKVIFGGRKNQDLMSKKPAGEKQQRFCELCGTYVGAMTSKDWDLEGRICKTCIEAYASSLEIEMDAANQSWQVKRHSWEMDAERHRISRFI
jgi:hypothetical protein